MISSEICAKNSNLVRKTAHATATIGSFGKKDRLQVRISQIGKRDSLFVLVPTPSTRCTRTRIKKDLKAKETVFFPFSDCLTIKSLKNLLSPEDLRRCPTFFPPYFCKTVFQGKWDSLFPIFRLSHQKITKKLIVSQEFAPLPAILFIHIFVSSSLRREDWLDEKKVNVFYEKSLSHFFYESVMILFARLTFFTNADISERVR